MKPVMINVDDLGLSEPVNEAVVLLAQMQRIQATSFMSQGKIAADAVNQLHQLNIDIGLHLDLTGFQAKASLKKILFSSYLHLLPENYLTDQINQQLDKFEDVINKKPIFIDGHQHVHQFPQIREALIRITEQRYGKSVGIRSTKSIQPDLKAQLIYHLGGKRLDTLLQKQGLPYNPAFGGVYDFNANLDTLELKWNQWLSAIPAQGAIIMCHPAVPSSTWQDEIKTAREREWQWLSSNAFVQSWQEQQCYSINWKKFTH